MKEVETARAGRMAISLWMWVGWVLEIPMGRAGAVEKMGWRWRRCTIGGAFRERILERSIAGRMCERGPNDVGRRGIEVDVRKGIAKITHIEGTGRRRSGVSLGGWSRAIDRRRCRSVGVVLAS